MKLTGENRSTRGKTCPCATLSTTNPTWTDPGSNPGFRGGRPAANRLSHGTAHVISYETSTFINTVLRTSNLACLIHLNSTDDNTLQEFAL
jgi:hypothetical protein